MAALYIDGKDAFNEWGVRMGDGFLDAIAGLNEMTSFVTNESRLEPGKSVVVKNPRVASREITLSFTITGKTKSDYRAKRNAFQEELEKGKVRINVPELGEQVYKLVFTGKSISYGLSGDRCFGHLSGKFIEPNPKDR